ncbi:MAG: hypothetical protein AAF170_00465 [Bacteroidota bacterium]
MSERRYSEREIREVFERAARDQEQAKASATQEGLTLDEMQEIAASAGIAPEFVANAARSVALGEPEQGRMNLGPIPRGVFRTEFLPGPPSATLWEDLVGDAQDMFQAQGTVTRTGRVREWRNGNLRVTLEPSGDGSRLRLQTRRDAVASQLTALAVLLIAAFSATFGSSAQGDGLMLWIGMLSVTSLVTAGIWAAQRTWATTRERQMEAIAERAVIRSQAAMPVSHPTSSPSLEAPSARSSQLDPDLLDLDALDTNRRQRVSRTQA